MEPIEEQVLELIRNSRLPRIVDDLTALLMYSIRLRARSVQESELELGVSKIGGMPDLPEGTVWPEWGDMPLAFIAQIRLTDIAPFDREGALPHTGMLYFFYQESEESILFRPEKQGDPTPWRALYYDGNPSQLWRTPAPSSLPSISLFRPCAVEFSTELTLPPFESPTIKRLGLTYDAFAQDAASERKEEAERYFELGKQISDLYGDTHLIHRLLGHPDPVQGDMQLECQLYSHGLSWVDYRENNPKVAELEESSTDWRLLLQIDSDNAAGMMWGDVGRIYYWIRRNALATRDFDQTWLVFQCC